MDLVPEVVAALMQVVSLNKSIITEQEKEMDVLFYVLFHMSLQNSNFYYDYYAIETQVN